MLLVTSAHATPSKTNQLTRSLSVGGPVGVSALAIAVATVAVFDSAKALRRGTWLLRGHGIPMAYITNGMVLRTPY